ncbi:MAG: UvrD-helicase domain-containing protein [Bacilli bacterium]|jgi:DNA helicase-2/ATP-dependent DNA helicase PcrA|nr:UvrD-helicase domain-containing protein [Bacilli bacterium]
MDYASLLNEQQLKAVETSSQYVRVIAGAGSGKTRVLTYRISYLISDRHVEPSRILAIAFTNKVANEMNSRAGKLVNELLGYTPFLHISTFHSFCARFLRSECGCLGYPSGFTIYDEDDSSRLIKSVAESLGYRKGDDMVKQAKRYISEQKLKGLYPDDISVNKIAYRDQKECYKFYQQYEIKKTLGFAFDFDDLLLKTIEVLEDYPDVRAKWQGRFDHILIDEFQDTNDIQYKLMRLLARPETSIYVVGDPDQTIYTWRGANQGIILGFEKTYPNVETIILNQNYRSTKTVLGAANKLIVHNKKRVPKDLFTNAGEGEPISVKVASTSEDEARWVGQEVAKVARLRKNLNGDPDYRSIAILYRSSYLTRPFEAELKDRGIPYMIFGGLRFYERAEVKDLLAYFNLLLNPADNVSFERIVNVPRRGVGDVSLGRIQQEALAKGLSDYEYLRRFGEFADDSEIPSRVATTLVGLVAEMEETKKKLNEKVEAYSSVLKDFATDIGYLSYLAEEEDPEEDRLKNVQSLFDDITHYLNNNPNSDFSEYLQNVALLTSQDDMSGGNYVSLMTIHIAKGLEFDNVFVIGLSQGVFPSVRAESESGRDGVEEERRLAYVALTRAKKRLFLSCNTAYSYVTDTHLEPSKFFKEAGIAVPEYNDWSNPGYGYSRPHSYQKGASSFFGDGGAISPFADEKEEPEEEKPTDNGIRDWKVGEEAHHEKFGDGKVVEIIDKNIIIVDFESAGKKTLLASHPMLSRVKSKGGEA